MDRIGLAASELNFILLEGIDSQKPVNAEKFREAISKAIEENNKKLLEDIKKMLT